MIPLLTWASLRGRPAARLEPAREQAGEREGRSRAYREPPAIAGRITSTSLPPTGVCRPSSTRTSSSLR